ncbi:MAG: Thymidylate kinase [Parcubacteria group bacterium GW2011_GWF2_44_7]|nr:MAG: Thymidylate kinase [Parcubacteria group bacterium GW2011_GWF2_44_7]
MHKKGKLIVLDGTDGSGKATQVKLLRARLVKEGYTVKLLDFPEYYKNFFGKFIGHCLSEQYYNWINVHPKIASISYAADRWESSEKIRGWLKRGYIVLSNRYASANQIHQGGKIGSASKRANFIKWLNKMEYEVFKIPRPDAVFYLNVPMNIILKLIKERHRKTSRKYLGKRKDIVEGNIPYLENSHKAGLWLARTQKGWIKIECAEGGVLESREAIHEKIYEKVKKILK